MPKLLPSSVKGKNFISRRGAHDLVERKACSSTRGYANPQLQSPLLSLPGEIRYLIYTYTCLADLDLSRPYPFDSFEFRPGNTHARFISTNLLLTCRKVFLEAYLLPIEVNEHIVYGCESSHAPAKWENYLPKRSKAGHKLNGQQRRSIKRVHIFAQQFWLEDFNGRKGGWADFCRSWKPASVETQPRETKLYWLKRAGRTSQETVDSGVGNPRTQSLDSLSPTSTTTSPGIQPYSGPEHLTITIRQSDWWYYLLGSASPLAIDPFRAGRPQRDRNLAQSSSASGSTASLTEPSHPAPCTISQKYTPCDEGSWASHFAHMNLKSLTLELETLVPKIAELEDVVRSAKEWRFQTRSEKILVPNLEKTKKWEWNRWSTATAVSASVPRPESAFWAAGRFKDRDPEDCYVVELVWKAVDPEEIADPAAVNQEGAEGVKGARPPLAPLQALSQGSNAATPAHPAAGTGTARAVGRDVIPSYWG